MNGQCLKDTDLPDHFLLVQSGSRYTFSICEILDLTAIFFFIFHQLLIVPFQCKLCKKNALIGLFWVMVRLACGVGFTFKRNCLWVLMFRYAVGDSLFVTDGLT